MSEMAELSWMCCEPRMLCQLYESVATFGYGFDVFPTIGGLTQDLSQQ